MYIFGVFLKWVGKSLFMIYHYAFLRKSSIVHSDSVHVTSK